MHESTFLVRNPTFSTRAEHVQVVKECERWTPKLLYKVIFPNANVLWLKVKDEKIEVKIKDQFIECKI